MVDADKISAAIAAHARWKHLLKNAIDTGFSEQSVSEVKAENACDFGRWLLSLPQAERRSQHWQKVRQLHAEFHASAAQVLNLALAGRRDQAASEMKLGGNFTRVSSQLTLAMADWKREAAG